MIVMLGEQDIVRGREVAAIFQDIQHIVNQVRTTAITLGVLEPSSSHWNRFPGEQLEIPY